MKSVAGSYDNVVEITLFEDWMWMPSVLGLDLGASIIKLLLSMPPQRISDRWV